MTHVGHAISVSKCYVDDAPSVLAHVLLKGCPTYVKGSGEIGLHYRLEAFGRQFFGRADELSAGIVDQKMQSVVLLDDVLNLAFVIAHATSLRVVT